MTANSSRRRLQMKSPRTDGDEKEEDYGLPDFHTRFINDEDLEEFEKALNAPQALSLVAINDWRPIHRRVRKPGKLPIVPQRTKDETREGVVYTLLKWPFLLFVLSWIVFLGALYILTRLYISLYEHFFAWTGQRQRLRRALHSTVDYQHWKNAAKELDEYLGNDAWKERPQYAYYDNTTVMTVVSQLRQLKAQTEAGGINGKAAAEELCTLLEGCIKTNFAGIENPRLYSETYYGTKDLVQEFIEEAHTSLRLVLTSEQLSDERKQGLFRHLDTNFGRTVLCLSGGATLAYYHFGVIKALLDNDVLPDIISGTSGGALVAALVATRTDEELKKLLVPELAHKIKACQDGIATWAVRCWRTGARFDVMQWAEQCSWFCRGSTTFREAYERTGRVLNVSCVPSDPHSPTILANYLTSPNCVIWSAVLASAAVPGILNPVVLMMKKPDGTLAPYSFGHKWKDGSLRTDIPLKALDVHFNASFSIVSQVNPHISLFFFSSRGSVGRPVTHRKGRGWRGGFLGSALEQYIKLDLNKWLKVMRHLELLPRPLGQDWSEIWLQRFSGTVTIWPKSVLSDLYYILSDPSVQRLARMLHEGQQCTFPKIKFISNRMKIERVIAEGLMKDPEWAGSGRWNNVPVRSRTDQTLPYEENAQQRSASMLADTVSHLRDTGHFREAPTSHPTGSPVRPTSGRRNSLMEEIRRQSAVFFDDTDDTMPSDDEKFPYQGQSSGTKIG
ncbi:hypothetical protein D8B26_008018 [Coccidioides posadasii str. Silveira]|uniref:Patatin-like phospholipase domain-containing protein n=2 Tax=Coccidioides posadasii TaxID=199306 RepID=E9DE85_COCPS|nr:patatin-like phospholipase domain-containing protein [Coccidioides posadasii str. Silveira]KMM70403.1 triacylglycerol lipase [Coccidioides posadasii RMSCC 3488]QVM13410.1 hypothetical protein D8B26_008018 [Coccidioides posadasii str. Silveira]